MLIIVLQCVLLLLNSREFTNFRLAISKPSHQPLYQTNKYASKIEILSHHIQYGEIETNIEKAKALYKIRDQSFKMQTKAKIAD